MAELMPNSSEKGQGAFQARFGTSASPHVPASVSPQVPPSTSSVPDPEPTASSSTSRMEMRLAMTQPLSTSGSDQSPEPPSNPFADDHYEMAPEYDHPDCETVPTSPPHSVISAYGGKGKRKLSATPSEISLSRSQSISSHISSSTSTSLSSKRGRMTGAIALTSIAHTISDLGNVLRDGIKQEDERHRARSHRRHQQDIERRETAQRLELAASQDPMVEAMQLAQEQEKDLTPEELAAFLEVFEDPTVARAYLAIKNVEVRKRWVNRKLQSKGTSLPNAAPA